ncbi:MAG: hypothetical protein IJ337_07025 [Clostridia bacterium]|nr:hypothetical protein [Clostridia bacterium]
MVKVERFDTVRLKDGRKGAVVDIYDDPPGYEIDFSINETFDDLTEGVSPDMIAEVIK